MEGLRKMNAIILAGGHGLRMIASGQLIHKPLLPVLGMPNIERTILMLKDYGVNDITIISGSYSNQYEYLNKKYNCSIMSDPNTSVSTLYGINSVINNIGDTFIIEGDVVLAENIFDYKPYSYYYVIKYPNCEPDAWKPITDFNGRINTFQIGCFKEPCVFGISFWSMNDAAYFRKFIRQVSTPENLLNNRIFWDDYFLDVLDEFAIYTYEISADSAAEMNDLYEYNYAKDLCCKYYSNPNKYFLNLQDYNNTFSFYVDKKQTVFYTKKLLQDYNFKHPDNIQDINIPIEFGPNEYSYIIKTGEENVGFIDLVFEKKYLLLRRIYINESHRNQSLGTKVLRKLIIFSKLINKELRVNVYDEYAAKFYKRLGFKENFVNYVLRSE